MSGIKAAFSWHLTLLLTSAYDHVQPCLHHCYLQQPTVIPCHLQASSLFFICSTSSKSAFFFFLCSNSLVFKLPVFLNTYCISAWHCYNSCLLLMSMLQLPPTNAMWSKTNHLASNIFTSTVICFCLFTENPCSTDA